MQPALLLLLSAVSATHAFHVNAHRLPVAQRALSPKPRALAVLVEKPRNWASGPSFGTHLALPLASYAVLGALSTEAVRFLGIHEVTTWCLMACTVFLPVTQLLWVCSRPEGIAERMGGYPADAQLVEYACEAADAVGVAPPDSVIELDAAEPNAFAASNLFAASRTVAVTRGLREKLSPTELRAVLAHEMGHHRNRDVVRNMHLAIATAGMAGVYEAGRIILNARDRNSETSQSDSDGEGGAATLGLALLAAGLMTQCLANLARLCASREAELQADRAAAAAFGADAMISALRKIDRLAAQRPADLRESKEGSAFAFAMISDGESGESAEEDGWWRKTMRVLRTHPPLEERVAALEQAVADGVVPAKSPKP